MKDQFKNLLPKITQNKKKHFVEIGGKRIQVSMQEKIEIIRNGEKNYTLRDGKPYRIETKTNRNRFPEIKDFVADPFWPEEAMLWKK